MERWIHKISYSVKWSWFFSVAVFKLEWSQQFLNNKINSISITLERERANFSHNASLQIIAASPNRYNFLLCFVLFSLSEQSTTFLGTHLQMCSNTKGLYVSFPQIDMNILSPISVICIHHVKEFIVLYFILFKIPHAVAVFFVASQTICGCSTTQHASEFYGVTEYLKHIQSFIFDGNILSMFCVHISVCIFAMHREDFSC